MNRKVIEWTISDLYKKREQIIFPDYQREPKLWSTKDKQLLVDSIINDIDIPKLYFHESDKNLYEVVDGQQRLWAIWEFLDSEYVYKTDDKKGDRKLLGKAFKDFPNAVKTKILSYPLQVTLIGDVSDDYLRTLFLRLQLGLLLISGEKLHAASGLIRDFIFKTMVKHSFIQRLTIPSRRYAKETLCAQICINSFSIKSVKDFSRTRYEDLNNFFEYYKKPEGADLKSFQERTKHIINVLNELNSYFGDKAGSLKNRSFILSVYIFVEEYLETEKKESVKQAMATFVKFIMELLKRLKEEAKAGIDRKNKELYIFESYLSNAPGEKYQIKKRHDKLKEFFKYYSDKGKIMGDK